MTGNSKKLLLVDGSYYAYRSFYAIREMEWGGDLSNNAVFGVTHDLRRMLDRLQPDLACVLWDGGLPERRMAALPTYKQQRDSMPDELKCQLDTIRTMVDAMGVKSVKLAKEEADDLVASYTKEALVQGCEVFIGTNDKDIFQIASNKVAIYSTAKKHLRNGEAWRLLRATEVEEVWGVAPQLIPDVLALMGDSSDNIPGIAGIGPKTAVKLIKAAGNIRELMNEPSKYASERFASTIAAEREALERNIGLVTLKDDLPLPEKIENLAVAPRYEELAELARGLGFNSVVRMAERGLEGGKLRAPSSTAAAATSGVGLSSNPPRTTGASYQPDLF